MCHLERYLFQTNLVFVTWWETC